MILVFVTKCFKMFCLYCLDCYVNTLSVFFMDHQCENSKPNYGVKVLYLRFVNFKMDSNGSL